MSALSINNPNMVLPLMNGRQTARQVMTQQEVEIRPEQAERWLKENHNNRPLNASVVARYAADMVSGNWKLTHQGIAFSPTGTLLDGQHRLNAIIKAGVPVRMVVAFNVPAEALLAVDQNHRRRVEEQLTLVGGMGDVDRVDIAILRAMINGLAASNNRRTFAEERDLITRYRPAIAFAREASTGRRSNISASVMAVFARAYYCADHVQIQAFAQSLIKGIAPTQGGESIAALIRWFLSSNAAATNRVTRADIYGRTSRALYAYLHGESLSKLYVPTHELFELPA